ncbi:MAG: chorismate synthase [Fusobacterium sp.]|uniref:chorismate synthase n=1 Tax=Fusobacterium sp. TaxID=68766 RepID=UPI0026DBA934|nr:chorismate synthase [Fusobacterium sp.]MDO4689774.1 chorismate synthase [Fusobacterium sp.]
MNVWGSKLRLSIFGESHGQALGIVIDGLPAGTRLNFESINFFIDRRRAGKNSFTTSRKEKDEYNILSGFKDGFTTGSPLCIIFENTDIISKDYGNLESLLRPSHADYPAKIKFKGFNDFRGGGHFSGRISLALAFAGAIAKDILKERKIEIYSHIKKIKHIEDDKFSEDISYKILKELEKKDLAFFNSKLEEEAKTFLEKVKKEGNSVGGEIECICLNLPVGLGSPFFDSLESKIAHLAFSVPAVKGIEFGIGFDFVDKFGSEANDEYRLEGDKIKTRTNNNGGILGGLSTGMPLIFSVVIKPTASIALEQKTINIKTMKEEVLKINGRHDACIVPRVLPIIEAIMALVILDEIL